MAKSVRHDDKFVEKVQVYAEVNHRSIPKQIEHWAQIGRIMEDNPDLTYEFVQSALVATAEVESGMVKKHVRRRRS